MATTWLVQRYDEEQIRQHKIKIVLSYYRKNGSK